MSIERPNDLVAIPPLARTVIYYALALALVVVSALTADGRLEPLYLVITSGVGGVFFGVAGSNVRATPAAEAADLGTPASPLAVELTDPETPNGGVWGGG